MRRLIFALLWVALGAWAQQYPFLLTPGSPKGISALFQDSKGRIWMMGSPAACFDGSRFFPLEDYGLPAATGIQNFAESPDGAIWIAADTGLFRYAQGHIGKITSGWVGSVVAPAPDVALVTMDGTEVNRMLVRFRRVGGEWKKESVLALDSPGPITANRAGTALALWPLKGVVEFRISEVAGWKAGTAAPTLTHIPMGVPGNGRLKAMRDQTGCLWVAVTGGNSASGCPLAPGRPEHPAGYWNSLIEHSPLEANMHESRAGMLLWGPGNLITGPLGDYRGVRPVNGLPALRDTMEGTDGTIWLATAQGLYRFPTPFRLEYWTVREGVNTTPWSLARLGDRVYAGLVDQIVVLGNDRRHWEPFANVSRGNVTALLATEDGNLLASTIFGEVHLLSPDGRLLAQTKPGYPVDGNQRLARGPNGEIWLGTRKLGLLHRRGRELEFEEHPLEGSRLDNVLAIRYQAETRKLWACYSSGVVVRDEKGSWREYTTRDGLPENACWGLVPLPNGDVWDLGATLSSLFRIRPGGDGKIAVRNYPRGRAGNAGEDVLSTDQSGRMWLGGGPATFAATPEQAENGTWLRFDESDGFRPDLNSGSFFADADGSFWAGADNDIFHYLPPADVVNPSFAPQVFLSAWSWENQPARMAEAVGAIPPGVKAVAHLGSLQFDRRQALRVRYRVLPEESSWRETQNLEIPLTGLRPGSHTLEFQGRVYTGSWSPVMRSSFTLLVPVWRTAPALGVYVLALLLMSVGGYFFHRRRVLEEAELLPDLAGARVRAFLPEAGEVIGTVLDQRFEVGELIAHGGFANVMDGYDLVARQRCAIKVFRGEVASKEWIRSRFEDEVAALRKIEHPNVVSIYAHGGIPSGPPYLVMEFVDGRDLREILTDGPLGWRRAGLILRQLADALDCIHRLGIWHRDVKPENIIVRRENTAEEQAVLIDFSIAIVKDANETLQGLSRAAGTFAYMAPEQAIGHAEPASDIYGLARVLVEMLTGMQMHELLPNAALDLPERVAEFLTNGGLGLSAESIAMIASAQEFDPGRRPSAAGVFAAPIVEDLGAGSD